MSRDRFLLDQSADARLLLFLRERGYDATRIGRHYPAGLADEDVLAIAIAEDRVLITDDRDFGELVFVHRRPHGGVIYLRLGAYAELEIKIARLGFVLAHYADRLEQFLVVSRTTVRVRAN